MFSINNFKDEKFRDTIKKNFYRLRQKSSNQLGEFLIGPTQTHCQNKIQNKDLMNVTGNNMTEKNIINCKLINLNQSKIYKKRKINSINEEKQIILKTKKIEENYNIPLKQRIFLKLKEERNEKMKNNLNDEKKVCEKETSFKNYIQNHKRIIGSIELKNVVYRNKNIIDNKSKEISTTIINDGKGKEPKSIKINLDKKLIINRNNKNLSSQGNRTIFDLNNIGTKFNNIHSKGIIMTKNKTDLIDNKNEFIDFSKSYLRNKINKFQFDNDQLSENLRVNKKNNINTSNKNDIILVQKRKNYFNEKMKLIMRKNEEEKTKDSNEEKTQRSVVLNKTFGKTGNKISLFNENFNSNELSKIDIKRKMRNNKSIKLSECKSFKGSKNIGENYAINSIEEKNDGSIKKKKNINKMIYLETEKPKLFSKSILFKNLMINTNYNKVNKINMKALNKNINTMKNIKETNKSKEEAKKNDNDKKMKINIDFINNYNNKNSLTTRNNKVVITDLFKNDKYYQKMNDTSTVQKELYNIDYVIKMIIEAIQLKNSIEIYSLFYILLINFNNKYVVVFSSKKFWKEVIPYFDCYKYLSIFIIPLIFFYKDENIYKINCSRVKSIFDNLIFICIENLGQKCLKYKKILSFIEEFKKAEKNNELYDTMEECCLELVKTIFKNYKDYIPLKKVMEQLIELASKESLEKIIDIINNTILYCFNHKDKNNFYYLTQLTGNNTYNYHNYKTNKTSNNDFNRTINSPSVPYIRIAMKKNFCLVLDIDETIIHTINLPFENYFLLRPGVIDFLEEISKLYEIIIFTSSPKSYADPILNKIDLDNKFFSYRLYKEHVIFEKGKSVKKLNMIGRDLNKIIFVDNMKCNAKYNLKNLYLISSWIQDINDQELIKLKSRLKYMATNIKFKDDITKGLEESA